jgi:hypothetical protein
MTRKQSREIHTRFWWKNLTLWNMANRWKDNLQNGATKGWKWTGLLFKTGTCDGLLGTC